MTNQRHKQQNKVGKKDTRADEDEKNNYKSILWTTIYLRKHIKWTNSNEDINYHNYTKKK